MALDTAILQGNFVGTGSSVFIPLRGGVDWIEVFNQTTAAAGAAVGTGYQFSWQRGMADGRGFAYSNPAVPVMAQLAAGTGFFYQNTGSVAYTFSPNAITDISAAGLVACVAHGLNNGDIVRLLNVVGTGRVLSAINWKVQVTGGANDANHFTLVSAPASLVHDAAPGASSQVVKISREGLYVPQDRVITAISQAAAAQITFAAPHGYAVGQDIRIDINPITNAAVYSYLKAAYGASPSLNPQVTVASVVDTLNITVAMNTVAMPAFSFPLLASVPFGPSQTAPIGMDTASALTAGVDILSDATHNIGQIGMLLASGVLSPAGVASDQIFWRAGVSFSVNNAF